MASELNSEFNNILNNARDLISPLTASLDMNGFELVLDADADTSITSDTDDRIDFRIGGTDSIFMGHASGNTGGFLTLDPLAFTSTASTDIGRMRIGNTNALTVPAGTTAVAAALFVEEPNLTATGTITSAVTLYIEAAPTEGGTNNYALWVDAGTARFDGIINVTGGQIAFPATQASSADVNTLDDYEEGTWTPVLTFATPGNLSVAYAANGQQGTYTKVGRKVTATCVIETSTFTHTTASGNLQVTGLPFAAQTLTGFFHHAALAEAGLTLTGSVTVCARLASAASLVTFVVTSDAGSQSNVASGNTTTGTNVIIEFTLTYEAAT